MEQDKKSRSFIREFFSLGEVGGYFFRKHDPNRPTNLNIRMMHGVNKISIAIFLSAVVYLIARKIF
jgi:hypothetical protein